MARTCPIAISASSEEALNEWSRQLAAHLVAHPEIGVADLACTLVLERPPLPHRRVVLVEDRQDAIRMLHQFDPKKAAVGTAKPGRRQVAFVFAGRGEESGQANAFFDFYQAEPAFRRHVDALKLEGLNLSRPFADDLPWEITNPALLAFEYALTQLWAGWGIRPVALMGFSLGELAAAVLSSVFDPQQGLALARERGRLFDSVPSGAMTSVFLSEAKVRPYLAESLEVAINRDSESCVVSGPVDGVEALEKRLADDKVFHMRLDVKTAGHSVMVDGIMDAFRSIVAEASRRRPQIPLVSNVSGGWLGNDEAIDPSYWARQLRETIQFGTGLQTLLESGADIILEIGPGAHLTSLMSRQLHSKQGDVRATPSISPAVRASHLGLLRTLGSLWVWGVDVDWNAFYQRHKPRKAVSLPN